MFNLNISEYSTHELEELFGLGGIQYSPETLQQSFQRTLNQTNQTPVSREFTSQIKKNTTIFLEKVHNILASKLKQSATIPQGDTNTIFSHTSYPVILPTNTNPGPTELRRQKIIVRKIFTFDSRFRDDERSAQGNFTLTLKETINNVESISVNNFSSPDKVVMISKRLGNNFFTLDLGGVRQVVEMPNFSQTFSSEITFTKVILFLKAFKNKMDRLGGLFERITLLPESIVEIAGSYADITDDAILTHPLILNNSDILNDRLVMTFDTSGLTADLTPPYIALHFDKNVDDQDDPTDIRKKLGAIMGFRNKTYIEQIQPGQASVSIVGDGQLDLHPIRYGYLVVDDFQTNGSTHVYGNDVTYSGCQNLPATSGKILSKLDFSRGTSLSGLDRFTDLPREYTGGVNINKFSISLLDEFGRVMDFANNNWSFTMLVNARKF